MREYLEKAKQVARIGRDYVVTRKQKIIIGGVVVLFAILIIALFAYNNRSTIVYQPPRACDLFSTEEAHELLGADVINKVENPVISTNVSTTRCSYTDRNEIADQMKIAAVAIRSGVNDEGVQEVSEGYYAKKPTENIEKVTGLGDDAYFYAPLGQLQVLKGRDWYIFSIGTQQVQEHTLSESMLLAGSVIQ